MNFLRAIAGTIIYFVGTLLASVAPRVSTYLFVLTAVYYALPGHLEKRTPVG
jgi:hypothetical protein